MDVVDEYETLLTGPEWDAIVAAVCETDDPADELEPLERVALAA